MREQWVCNREHMGFFSRSKLVVRLCLNLTSTEHTCAARESAVQCKAIVSLYVHDT